MALLTSDSIINATKINKYLGLSKYFTLTTGLELTPSPRVSSIPAKKVCRYLKIKERDTVCIGDAFMDMMMAKKAKLKACIAVASGQTPYIKLRQKTTYIFHNSTELTLK